MWSTFKKKLFFSFFFLFFFFFFCHGSTYNTHAQIQAHQAMLCFVFQSNDNLRYPFKHSQAGPRAPVLGLA